MLLAEGLPAVTVSSSVLRSRRGTAPGVVHKLAAGALVLRGNLRLATRDAASRGGAAAPRPAGEGTRSRSTAAIRGKLEVAPQGRFLRTVNVVPLERTSRASSRTRCRILAARGAEGAGGRGAVLRACKSLVKGKPFDLYSDVRSQVYGGVEGGGRALGGGAGDLARDRDLRRPGRDDLLQLELRRRTASAPTSSDSTCRTSCRSPTPGTRRPRTTGGDPSCSARGRSSRSSASTRVLDAAATATPSGRLRSFTLQTVEGPTKMPAALLRTGLGLRSTWVTIGVLRLDAPAEPSSTAPASAHRHRAVSPRRSSSLRRAARAGRRWARSCARRAARSRRR